LVVGRTHLKKSSDSPKQTQQTVILAGSRGRRTGAAGTPGSPEPAEVDYCVENSGVRLPNCYRVPPPPRTARNPNGLQPDVTSVEFQSASALSATRRTPTVRSVSHATLDPAHSPTTVALDLTGPNMSTVKSHPAAVIDIGAAHVPDQQHPRLPRRLNAWRPAARTGTNPDSRWSAPWDFLHFGTERQRRRRPPPQPERRSHRLRLSTRTCRSSDARSRAPNGFSSATTSWQWRRAKTPSAASCAARAMLRLLLRPSPEHRPQEQSAVVDLRYQCC